MGQDEEKVVLRSVVSSLWSRETLTHIRTIRISKVGTSDPRKVGLLLFQKEID